MVVITVIVHMDTGFLTKEGKHCFPSLTCVGATRLERATAWSQTRNATNCATPRLLFASECKFSTII